MGGEKEIADWNDSGRREKAKYFQSSEIHRRNDTARGRGKRVESLGLSGKGKGKGATILDRDLRKKHQIRHPSIELTRLWEGVEDVHLYQKKREKKKDSKVGKKEKGGFMVDIWHDARGFWFKKGERRRRSLIANSEGEGEGAGKDLPFTAEGEGEGVDLD